MSSLENKKEPFISNINRVKIKFPFKPYPSQMMMMEKIIKTLSKPNEHALLESPTGTGKTLALLCSVLSWRMNIENPIRNPKPDFAIKEESIDITEPTYGLIESETEEELDMKEEPKKPKVYFATRTHRQIKQVVSELKEAGYDIPMAVLGSKKNTCVNPIVNKKTDIDDECFNLRKDKKCRLFFSKERVVDEIKRKGIHDIEDLVRVGKSKQGCPYYASKDLEEEADIVFLPYNYILSRSIRKAAGISLKNKILIFDEAHNIEDACREAGSFNTNTSDIGIIIQEMSSLLKTDNEQKESLYSFISLFKSLFEWIQKNTLKEIDTESVLNGKKIISFLDHLQITDDSLDKHRRNIISLRSHDREEEKKEEAKEKEKQLSKNTYNIIEEFIFVLKEIKRNGKVKGINNFCITLERKKKYETKNKTINTINLTINCLFPAIVFEQVSKKARNIILTSGTLSPLETFSSELGVKFNNVLEAPHVVKQDQIYTSVFPKGPNGYEINGVYKNAITEEYQRNISESIKEISFSVPFGVLCFFPSYGASSRTINLMKKTNAYNEILKRKDVFIEPQGGSTKDFNKTLKEYYLSIKKGKQIFEQTKNLNQKNGALLIAVYRGKISEGLDFVDDNARCVICVGIPYPNFKSGQISSKIDFNTNFKRELNLMHGRSWYEAQAYKALNQALGRCIRHSEDWGAIILLESRFEKENSIKNISKWAKNIVTKTSNFEQAINSLTDFMKTNLAIRKNVSKKISFDDLSDGEEEDKENKQTWFKKHKKDFN